MKILIKGHRFLILALLAIFLSGCGQRLMTSLVEVTLASAITPDNRPLAQIESVSASLSRLYLTGRLISANSDTVVTVRWYRGGEVISTQILTGQRDKSNPYEFVGEVSFRQPNYFASILERPGERWPQGDYRVEAYLLGSLAKTIDFSVVTEAEAETAARRASVTSLSFGTSIAGGALAERASEFSSSVESIFVAVEVKAAPVGDRLKVFIEYLPSGVVLVSFIRDLESGVALFELSRKRLAPILGGTQWKSGLYKAEVFVDDIFVRQADFRVR